MNGLNTFFPYPWFSVGPFNSLVALGIISLFILIFIYSLGFMKLNKKGFYYYTCIFLTAIVSVITVLANNLMVLLVGWGFLGLLMYLLINLGPDKNKASLAAKKSFIIVGGSDVFMILGISMVYFLCGTFQMDKINIPLTSTPLFIPTVAYLSLAVACFAKAGAMPLHSWIPDCAESAPIPVTAILPASLDKLLGIYLLVKISQDLFILNPAMRMLLMLLGAFTIISAVFMALVQHNSKRLLGYHAVSQVGYMVLGIGTGNPLGIIGGIFHMFNNVLYKTSLFLSVGNIEHRLHNSELNKQGGLAKYMPLTYLSVLIASLSISGIPPFNGFFSKWMIYQGLISQLWVRDYKLQITAGICLTAAMFGSGLTLASFMKLLHASFLGQPTEKIAEERPKEVSWLMWFPALLLSFLCLLVGVAVLLILASKGGKELTYSSFLAGLAPLIAFALILVGLLSGIIIYYFLYFGKLTRQDQIFIGGELIPLENKVSGTEFYNTISEIRILGPVYKKAEAKIFDIYEQGKNLVFAIGRFFQYLHNGVLPTYLVWMLMGMIGLFWFFAKR
ncbi:MAG: proton-conducting transporter membrane subunit [Candidatus Omnitrophota bacterium]